MPNWCEGNIRFRGRQEDFIEMVKTHIRALKRDDNFAYSDVPVNVEVRGDYLDITRPGDSSNVCELWFLNSERQFIDADPSGVAVYIGDGDEEEDVYLIDHFRAAWDIKADYFKLLAKEFHLDIRIIGYESGCQFVRRVTINRNGRIEEDSTSSYKEYKDWKWSADHPYWGG